MRLQITRHNHQQQTSSRGYGGAGWLCAALAAELTSRRADFHDLEDYYRYAGYADEVIAWVETTQITKRDGLAYVFTEGRDPYDVAVQLGLDVKRLAEAASDESVEPRRYDPGGNHMYRTEFWDNWAVGNESGHLAVNPKAYRFKAWVAFTTDTTDR